MKPEALDRRLTVVQQVQIGTSPLGTPVYSDEPNIKTVWAANNDVSDGERFAAGQVGSHIMTLPIAVDSLISPYRRHVL